MGCIVLSVFFFAILRVVAGKPLLALLQRLIIFVSFKRVFCLLLHTNSANEAESFFSAELQCSRVHGSGLVVGSIGLDREILGSILATTKRFQENLS